MKKKWMAVLSLALCLGVCGVGICLETPVIKAKAEETVYTWDNDYIVTTSLPTPDGYSNNPWFGNLVIGIETDNENNWAEGGGSRTVRIGASDNGYNCNLYNSQEIEDSLQKVTYTRGGTTISAIGYYVLSKGVFYGFDGGAGTAIEDLGTESQKGDVFEIAEDFTFKLEKGKGDGWTNRTFRYEKALSFTYDGSAWRQERSVIFTVDGEVYGTDTVLDGDNVTRPEDPAKVGYVFDGWYNG